MIWLEAFFTCWYFSGLQGSCDDKAAATVRQQLCNAYDELGDTNWGTLQ